MKQWKQALQKTHGAWKVSILNDMCAPFSKSLSRNWELHGKNKEQRAFETVDVARIQVSSWVLIKFFINNKSKFQNRTLRSACVEKVNQ